jgi:hypothetical protein
VGNILVAAAAVVVAVVKLFEAIDKADRAN